MSFEYVLQDDDGEAAEQPFPAAFPTSPRVSRIEELDLAVEKTRDVRVALFDVSLRGYRENTHRRLTEAATALTDILKDSRLFVPETEETAEVVQLRGTSPEAAEGPEQDDKRVVSLMIDGHLVSSDELGLRSENDLAFLAMLPDFSDGERFATKDVLERDFHPTARAGARKQAFSQTRAHVMDALEQHMGRPVIRNEGVKSASRYWLEADVTRAPETEENEVSTEPLPKPEAAYTAPPQPDVEAGEEDESTRDRTVVFKGLAARLDKERQASDEAELLRDGVTPHVRSLIADRQSKQRKGLKNSPYVSKTDNLSLAMRLHWGIEKEGDEEPAAPQDLEEVAIALGITPYSSKSMIRDGLKQIISWKDPKSAKAARDYLDFLDSL